MKLAAILAVVLALVAGSQALGKPETASAQFPVTLTVTKSFTPASIVVNTSSTLRIAISNANPGAIGNTSFSDTMPAGLVATPSTGTSTCPGVAFSTTAITGANMTIPANSSCVITVSVTSATAGTYVNSTGLVTVTQALVPSVTFGPAVATLVVTAAAATATPIPTATAIPAPPIVIPQVIQNPAIGGIFNGTRNNTPTPVRQAVAAVVIDPGAMPVLRPPSTGEAGLAASATTNVYYGLAIIAALGIVTFGAARLRTVRQK